MEVRFVVFLCADALDNYIYQVHDTNYSFLSCQVIIPFVQFFSLLSMEFTEGFLLLFSP